jgi:Protein of unknown function (DUF3102)
VLSPHSATRAARVAPDASFPAGLPRGHFLGTSRKDERMTHANEPTLADRAAEINRLYEGVDRADGAAKRKRIEVGNALIEARKHVPAGEWNAWCKTNIPRSRQDIARVMKMAGAEDPDAAHESENAARRAAVGRNTVLHASPPPAVLAEGGFFGPAALVAHLETPAPVVEVVTGITTAPKSGNEADASEVGPTHEQYRFAYFNRANDAMRVCFLAGWSAQAGSRNVGLGAKRHRDMD